MPIDKSVLEHLYINNRLSMEEISKNLNVSLGSVVWWMKKYEIKSRNRSDANYEKYNKSGDPFNVVGIDSIEKALIYGLGVGLFWGEGNKRSTTSLRLGNTDPDLIKTYVSFLKVICNVRDSKIRFGLQLFNDSDEEEALKFWLKELAVPRDRFMKTVSKIMPQGKGNYKRKNAYGVVTVYVNNIKLVDWMNIQLDNLKSPGSSVVERIHGGSHDPAHY